MRKRYTIRPLDATNKNRYAYLQGNGYITIYRRNDAGVFEDLMILPNKVEMEVALIKLDLTVNGERFNYRFTHFVNNQGEEVETGLPTQTLEQPQV